MKNIDSVLKNRSAALLRDFETRHDLHDIVEITSTKASHILLGVYEDRDGKFMARIQPAHLFDGRFKAGTFSLSVDQLDALIEALEEIRQVLNDKPVNRVHVVKPATKKVATVTQAPAPAPAEADQVLAAVNKLAQGLEALAGRLEALEASVPQEATKPQKPQVNTQEVKEAIEWQLWHAETPYSCPSCGKEYKSRGRFLNHVSEEHGIVVEG